MKKRCKIIQKLSFLLFLTSLIIIPLVSASPNVDFVPPTPTSPISTTNYTVNISSSSTGDHYTFLIKDSDLELWYRFENSTAGVTDGEYDWSGNSRHGDISANIVGLDTSGAFNNSIQFDGDASSRGEVTPDSSISSIDLGTNTDSHFAYSFWNKFSGTHASSETVFDFLGAGATTSGMSLRTIVGELRFQYNNGSTIINNDLGFDRTSILDEWHHYVITYNSSDILLYLDGELNYTIAETNLDATPTNVVSPKIGCRSVSTYICLNGSVDEFLIFSRNLNESEIKSLYNATANQYLNDLTLSGSSDSLQAYSTDEQANSNSTSLTIEGPGMAITWPPIHQTYQRLNTTHGTVLIKGTSNFASGNFSYEYIGALNSSITGSGNFTSDDAPDNFEINASFPVGAFNLTIYDTENPDYNDTVNDIRVGDIFWLTGQSNGKLVSNDLQTFSGPYALYEFDGEWTETTSAQRGWINIFSNISTDQDVPIAYYYGPENGVEVLVWLEGGLEWNESISNYTSLFNGTNLSIATTLMYQGESDAAYGDSEAINKQNYIDFAQSTVDYFPMITEGVLMGQINQIGVALDPEDLVKQRRPTQQLWEEDSNIYRGPSTYDINLSSDNVHFRTYDEHRIVAERWIDCINAALYSGTKCTQTNVTSISAISQDRFRVTFSNPIYIAGWNGTIFNETRGFRLTKAGENPLNDSSGISSAVNISSTIVEVNLTQNITGTWNISYGRARDSNPEITEALEVGNIRDANERPVEILWDFQSNFDQVNISFVSPSPANNSDITSNYTINLSGSSTNGDYYTFLDKDNDLLLWLTMEENQSATIMNDKSSYGNNATASGDYSFLQSGIFGNAVELEGSNDFFTLGESINFGDNQPWTASAWVYNKQEGDAFGNFMGNVSCSAGNACLRFSDSHDRFWFQDIENNFNSWDVTAETFLNKWAQITIVANSSGYLRTYVNGEDLGAINPTGPSNFTLTRVGGVINNLNLNGTLDDVLVFNRTLNSSEVSSLYNSSANSYINDFTISGSSDNLNAWIMDVQGQSTQDNLYLQGDTLSPTVVIVSPVGGSSIEQPFTLNVSLNESGNVNYSLDSGITNLSLESTGAFYYSKTITDLPEGSNTINIYAEDDAGNKNNTESVQVTIVSASDSQDGGTGGNGIGRKTRIYDSTDEETLEAKLNYSKIWASNENNIINIEIKNQTGKTNVDNITADFDPLDLTYTIENKAIGQYILETDRINIANNTELTFLINISKEDVEITKSGKVLLATESTQTHTEDKVMFSSIIEGFRDLAKREIKTIGIIAGITSLIIATLIIRHIKLRSRMKHH